MLWLVLFIIVWSIVLNEYYKRKLDKERKKYIEELIKELYGYSPRGGSREQ
jgi:hypothetical protein